MDMIIENQCAIVRPLWVVYCAFFLYRPYQPSDKNRSVQMENIVFGVIGYNWMLGLSWPSVQA